MRAVDLDTYARDMWPRLLLAYRERQSPTRTAPARGRVARARARGRRGRQARARAARSRSSRTAAARACAAARCRSTAASRSTPSACSSCARSHTDELICDVEAGPRRRAVRARARAPRLHVRSLPVVDLLLDRRRLARDPRGRPAVDEVRQGRGPRRRADRRHRARRGDRDRRSQPRAARPELDPAARRQRGHARPDHVGAPARLAGAAAARVPRLRGRRRRRPALEAIRRVLQKGLRPAVVRLYDELDTLMNSFGHHDDEGRRDRGRAARCRRSRPARCPRWPEPAPPQRRRRGRSPDQLRARQGPAARSR